MLFRSAMLPAPVVIGSEKPGTHQVGHQFPELDAHRFAAITAAEDQGKVSPDVAPSARAIVLGQAFGPWDRADRGQVVIGVAEAEFGFVGEDCLDMIPRCGIESGAVSVVRDGEEALTGFGGQIVY